MRSQCRLPVSTPCSLLNTLDRKARELPPSVIKNVNTPLFTSFSSRVTRIFEGVVSSSPKSRSPSRPPLPHKMTSGFELGGPSETIDGVKEERRYVICWERFLRTVFRITMHCRFLALNPRGTLDFALPSEGNISGYFGESLGSTNPEPINNLFAIHFRYDYCE